MLHSTGVLGIWWLTRHAQPQHLRRLQWAAQSRGIPLFASRPLACRQDPSPAPLRLHLQAGPEQSLRVQILKRQGPRHEQALSLPAAQALHLLPSRPSLPHVVDCAVSAPVAA
jgi:protein ImuA